MSAIIINAAPLIQSAGTQDLSTRTLSPDPESVPQHLPKIYIYAKKGPTTPQLVSGQSMTDTYHADSFDYTKKWANHATVFANLINAEANQIMMQRVKPLDAGPNANIILWLDVLPAQIDLNGINGGLTYNGLPLTFNGSPISTSVLVPGYKCKWVVTYDTTNTAAQSFGQRTISAGDQVAGAVQSQRFPMFEWKADSFGANGNNSGIRFYAPTVNDSGFPSQMMAGSGAYPYRFSMVNRASATGSANIVLTQDAEQYATVVLKPGALDPTTTAQVYIGDILLDKYQNLNDPKYPAVHGDFGSMAIYQANIDTLLAQFYAAENAQHTNITDFTGAADEKYMFNMLNGKSSDGTSYATYQLVNSANSVLMSSYSNIFANGGSDGTMNDTAFATLVSTAVQDYGSTTSSLLDIATNVESIIYDSGFPLATKYDLCNFISQRKDTFVVLSTFTAGGVLMSPSEERSLAIALRTRLQMYPESDYYGTPVMRGMIMGRSAKLRNSVYTARVPLSVEVAVKAARYMGAANGSWKNGYAFDGAPNSILENVYDVSINFTPATTRNKDWDAGLNWAQTYDRRSMFLPALKTVCANDTSVLNSFFTAMAIGQLNKVAYKAWREFSGVSHLTDAQLVDRVNAFVNANIIGRFDGRFVIIPDAQVTDADKVRGYSWHLPIKIFSSNLKTVCVTSVQAYRISDYTAV